MSQFEEYKPSTESYWRSIILFGRNVASYKFAFGNVLLELADKERTSITLDELALPFAKHIARHLKISDKQITSSSSKFLDVCRQFNENRINEDTLRNKTAQMGFVNVIDAFHNVNQGELPVRFYVDERQNGNRIVITDELLKLKEFVQFNNLPQEIEARWRLVETAWGLNISANLLSVNYSEDEGIFYTESDKIRRINITSARDALNGYQKGKCFYCFADISIKPGNENLVDVDHFFAHSLRILDKTRYSDDLNGVWNLVLACSDCNRGESGKFAAVPTLKYLERLHTRNSFLINSHHPLRETLINYTGKMEADRQDFLQAKYNFAKELLVCGWEAKNELEPEF